MKIDYYENIVVHSMDCMSPRLIRDIIEFYLRKSNDVKI
jgi:hypothetical protein